MSKDTTASQLHEAVGRKRIASSILEYFIAVFDKNKRYQPNLADDDPALWLNFRQDFLADKFHCSVKTISRHLQHLITLGYLMPYQKGGYDRSYSYELKRKRISSLYQEMPLFEGITESEEDTYQLDKMSPSNQTECLLATRQNVSFQPDKMSTCSMSSILSSNLPSSSVEHDDAETENCIREKRETELQPVQSHERQQPETSYTDEKEHIITRFRECDIVKEHAEAAIAKYGIHLCTAVLCAVELKKRKGEYVQGKGGGLVNHGLKLPACLGLEMSIQGQWLPASMIARQMKLKSSAVVTVAHLEPWEQLTYSQQTVIRNRIDQEHTDRPAAVRLQLYKKAAHEAITHTFTSGTVERIPAVNTQETASAAMQAATD